MTGPITTSQFVGIAVAMMVVLVIALGVPTPLKRGKKKEGDYSPSFD